MWMGSLAPWALFGLLALSLPVIAHLLTRRNVKVVSWGATQFLRPAEKTKRSLRLQDLLLLLVRLGIILCLILSLAQLWLSGPLLSFLGGNPPLTEILILDCSSSMGLAGSQGTPFQRSKELILDKFHHASDGDSITLILSRQLPERSEPHLAPDLDSLQGMLNTTQVPFGASHLPAALEEGLKSLIATSFGRKIITVYTDQQAIAWQFSHELQWGRIQGLLEQFATPPEIRIVSFDSLTGREQNLAVSTPVLSRNTVVPGFPVSVKSLVRRGRASEAQSAEVQQSVEFKINGQALPDVVQDVTLSPDGESTVEFTYRFEQPGDYLLSISVPADDFPDDDQAEVVVSVLPGIPVLIVDGDPRLDPTKSEAFYLEAAFNRSNESLNWVQAKVVTAAQFDDQSLQGQQVVFLLNPASLSLRQVELLRGFVRAGGGLIVAPGDKSIPALFDVSQENETDLLLTSRLKEIVSAASDRLFLVSADSLERGWLRRFSSEMGHDFLDAKFEKLWQLTLPDEKQSSLESTSHLSVGNRPPVVLAETTNRMPLIVEQQFGQGRVILTAFPLDADWGTLPARSDFVPFVYELVFHLSGQQAVRNVGVGHDLLLPLPGQLQADYEVTGPGIQAQLAQPVQRGQVPYVLFTQTYAPGVYWFNRLNALVGQTSSPFMVYDDGSESDLTLMNDKDWERLQSDYVMIRNAASTTAGDWSLYPRRQLWWGLMICVGILMFVESWLTRQMVQGSGRHVLPA